MWATRRFFPKAHLALLCDRHPGKSHVVASSLLRGSGIFDEYLSYPVSETTELARKSQMAALLATIRARRFDTLVYLAPTNRRPDQIARDRRFFRMAGIRNFIAMNGFEPLPAKEAGQPMAAAEQESQLLLKRLELSGVEVTTEDRSRMDLGLGDDEDRAVTDWLAKWPEDGGRAWVAVGPGSKMPSKRWPLRRFEQVGRGLDYRVRYLAGYFRRGRRQDDR